MKKKKRKRSFSILEIVLITLIAFGISIVMGGLIGLVAFWGLMSFGVESVASLVIGAIIGLVIGIVFCVIFCACLFYVCLRFG